MFNPNLPFLIQKNIKLPSKDPMSMVVRQFLAMLIVVVESILYVGFSFNDSDSGIGRPARGGRRSGRDQSVLYDGGRAARPRQRGARNQ
ncbi:unnamed protein product [Linum trigynum]|uniref:Uncharacterized protein n=1 Tax=Linum trigynum TaxID=586398 RepID=A0AAV2E5P5_9ROSI